MTVYLVQPQNFNPLMQVAACYMEFNEEILLLLRQDHKPQGNTWCLPGGKLDQNDTPLDAVVREGWEETAIKLEKDKIIPIRTFYIKYPEMDFIYHLFHARLLSQPKVIISLKEHKRYQWAMPIDALKLPLTPDEDVCMKMFYGIRE